jgi:glycosyltransferase involved in cell wall biosynthesis
MKSKPKVLYIANAYIESFHSTSRIEISKALKKMGLEIEPMFFYKDAKHTILGLSPIHFVRCYRRSYLNSVRTLIKVAFFLLFKFKKYEFVIIEPNAVFALLPFALAKRIFPLKSKILLDIRTQPVEVPQNIRGMIMEAKFDLSIKIALRYFDGMIVITEGMEKFIRKKGNFINFPIGIWTSGVNLELFNPKAEYELITFSQQRFVVMYHGTLSPNRGLDNVLLAAENLRKEYPEIFILFLGSGEMEDKLKGLIQTMNLHENAMVHKPVPYLHIPRYIKAAHVGILPFPNLEWWNVQSPLKLLEYLAMEKPVIASDIPMNRDVVKSRNCAFFIKDNSPEQIYEGIKKAIAHKEDLTIMGALGRAIVEKEFTWEHQAKKILDYLKTV